MRKKTGDSSFQKLVDINIKTQKSSADVVTAINSLVSAIKDASDAPDEELKYSQDDKISAISSKLDKVLQQNEMLIKLISELANNPKPQEYRRI